MRAFTAAFVCFVSFAVTAFSQTSSQTTFRAGVDLVEVDVAVLDKNRQPVRGLTAADFTLYEDGKPRPVAAFTAVDLPGRAVDQPGAAWMRDAAPDVTSNDALPEEGRLLVIFMDYTIPLGDALLRARDIARAAIRDLGAGDLASIVYALPGGEPQDFTNDRARLLSIIDGAYPGTESSADVLSGINDARAGMAADIGRTLGMEDISGQCYCGTCTHYAVARVADAVRDIDRRRKTMLFLASNLQTDWTSQLCGPHIQKGVEVMFNAVDNASMTIHSVDVRGLETGAITASSLTRASTSVSQARARTRGIMVSQGNLSVLPDRTGGRTVKNTNAPQSQIPAILEESDSYYLIGFEPAVRGDGKTHKIEVKVNRRGFDVRTRHSYLSAAPAPPTPVDERARAVSDGVIARRNGMTVGASAAALLTPGTAAPLLAVSIRAQHDPSASASQPERVDLVTTVLKMTGEQIATLTETLEVTPDVTDQSAPSYEIVQRLPIESGRYEVRVGLHNRARDHSGSVYTFVDVPELKKTRVFLSDVAIGVEADRPAVFAASFGDVLPFAPTARREFRRDEKVTAFLRLHKATAAAADMTITSTVVDPSDRKRFERTIRLAASDVESNMAAHALELPLRELTSGDYLLTIEARAGASVAKRQVRFAVK